MVKKIEPSEFQIQSAFVEWCNYNPDRLEDLDMYYATPNEGNRTKGERIKRIKEGMKKGVPDWCLPVPKGIYHGLFLEFKSKDGRLTKEQFLYLKRLSEHLYKVAVPRSLDQAIEVLRSYYASA